MEGSLEKLFEQYISECRFTACLQPETIRGYESVFALFLKVVPEVISVDLLSTEMLNEFFKRIQTRQRIIGKNTIKTGVKKSTIKTQWSKLNAFFGWLCKNNYIQHNPLQNIRPPRVQYDDFRKLDDQNIRKIYAAITLHSSTSFQLRRDTAMVSLLLFCGLRKGELLSLQVSDIDIEKREIIVRKETSKSVYTRVIKMHPSLLMNVKEYIRERNNKQFKTPYFITSSKVDEGLTTDGLKHWVNSLVIKSGVKFHLHQFRHTFACKLAEADVSVFKIQKLMGHSDIKMTMRYARSLKTENMDDDICKISI